jgi:ubiquinone/menaquinone biosynthesis C-methylase UbiE
MRFLRRHASSPTVSTAGGDDALEPLPPLECTAEEVERWNGEWLAYLAREWQQQLTPHTAYPGRPPLPATAREMLAFRVDGAWPLALYCDPDALEGRRVMEMGCGCGNLGKLVGRYVESYLGTDYSTLALAVARLVSPSSCAYVHVADRAALEPFFGTIETVVGRYFWIHQNRRLARLNLDYLARFLVPGGRLYADFYWPDPAAEQGIVLDPDQPLSRAYPSATFRYTLEDVARTVEGRPFRILGEEVAREMQRRFVVLERLR